MQARDSFGRTRLSGTAAPNPAVVLAVDDDPQVRLLIRNALTMMLGVQVVAVEDGEEGLLRAWELAPALVLADLLMPGMDGATFCRVLRAHPLTAATPIVAISGVDPESERARALREHCQAWLGKPFEVDELLAIVRAVVAHHRAPAPSAAGLLTERQRDVVRLIARAMSNREIAAALVLEEGTVANHVRRILLKLGLRSRTQLAVWAVEHGLVGPVATPDR